ncbi:hypothetical protein C8R46DRAFT_1071456 [Mycena filopes]|nr:hypothetical protein C8R46DRAFT_1071456 [Mycena filopes]
MGANVECDYSDKEHCIYGVTGPLISGSSICPRSLDFTVQSGQPAVCPPLDNGAGFLLGFIIAVDHDEINECDYSDGQICTYDFDGNFDSGSSTCPQSIAVSPSTSSSHPNSNAAAAAAAPAAGKALLAEDNNNSTGSSTAGSSSNDTTISKPILFALLGMNSVLVLAVLVIAGVWIFGRRSASSPSRLRSLSTGSGGYKTVESVSVPLSYGSDERRYSDDPKRS